MEKAVREQIEGEMKDVFGFVPKFYQAVPEAGRAHAWGMQRDLELGETVIPGKYKELIGVAVAAQIKCSYCVYFHSQAAKLLGATDEELKEACLMGGFTAQMSNAINGAAVDLPQFKQEVDRAVQHMKAHAPAAHPPTH